MAYKSDTIATVMGLLNTQYFLPAIQREFVWDSDKIISLFDSIMRGYPISSFLFWHLTSENKAKWEIYKFIEHAKDGGKRNETASTEGVSNLILILDGQQRLTSLLVGLKGTYQIKMKYARKKDPFAWTTKRLYLNLLKDPKKTEEDGEIGLHYDFKFIEDKPSNSDGQYWFKVGHILDFDDEEKFYQFIQNEKEKLPDITTKKQLGIFELNLGRLWRSIWKDDFIAYYVEQDQEYDRVLDIFVRANEGGTKLSKSDLLLSLVTSKWEGINARDEIRGFVDNINEDLSRKNEFTTDFIMKSCLVLSDLPVAYKVDNFTDSNLSLIQKKWARIKDAVEKGTDFINTLGIDRDNLTSVNALIPLIYYIFQHPDINLNENTTEGIKNASAMRCWITISLINSVFGGSSDSLLTELRRVLKENSSKRPFPMDELNKESIRAHRNPYFDDFAIDNYLSMTYGKKLTFLALSLLYDDNNWGTKAYHQDHIFPSTLFAYSTMKAQDYTDDQWLHYDKLKNSIANLEILQAQENQEKSGKPFDQWLPTRDASFRKRHLIPDENNLFKFENFELFIKKREELIINKLKQSYSATTSQSK